MFKNIKKIHFVGIGGIGMSGIAEILLSQGFIISGSDRALSDTTERLASLGIKIYEGHAKENLADVDVLVYSSAVNVENPEVKEAIERKIPVIKRSEMLAELMRMKYGVGIAGTHGKTTTTSMVGLVLTAGMMDPTIIVGGKLSSLGGTNARLGGGEFIVVEADEFDRTFLKLTPTIAALTTLEREHLDTYKDLDDIKAAFVEFANKVPFYGFNVICLDEPALQDIIPNINKKIFTYGTTSQADIRAIDIKHNGYSSEFNVKYMGEDIGKIKLNVPGLHNVKNSLVALTVGRELGISLDVIKKALESFSGVYRRFETKYNQDIMVIDDYAHHPPETSITFISFLTCIPLEKNVKYTTAAARQKKRKYSNDCFNLCILLFFQHLDKLFSKLPNIARAHCNHDVAFLFQAHQQLGYFCFIRRIDHILVAEFFGCFSNKLARNSFNRGLSCRIDVG
ncbi:MAG TPA: UDP-N-acetylmuramate--L-alanine ligase, partial [Ignavibacteriales bacterium]|nr:UDP-N-acetylmuramate--L-alanine ligase [Ignavibacteriales bacterium]